jgi:hypothetical protein
MAAKALTLSLREPRPAGFPLLHQALAVDRTGSRLSARALDPARAHPDTLRTYAEILYDWFETLEQNDIRGTARTPSTWSPIATA